MARSDPIQKISREEQNGQQIILSGQNRTHKARKIILQNDIHVRKQGARREKHENRLFPRFLMSNLPQPFRRSSFGTRRPGNYRRLGLISTRSSAGMTPDLVSSVNSKMTLQMAGTFNVF